MQLKDKIIVRDIINDINPDILNQKKIKPIFIFYMKNFYLIFTTLSLLMLLFSCEKKISKSELNASIKKHKKEQLFLSFYTYMPQKYEDALVDIQVSEGKLLKKREYEIDWLIYPLIYDDSKVADFNFYYMRNKVVLLSQDKDTAKYNIYDYEYKFQRILNILENKYEQKFKNRHLKYNIVYDSLVLRNKEKVITMTGSYSNNYNYTNQRVEGGSNIELTYYTIKSFGDELKKLKNKKLDDDYWKKKKNQNINDNNKKTIEDL